MWLSIIGYHLLDSTALRHITLPINLLSTVYMKSQQCGNLYREQRANTMHLGLRISHVGIRMLAAQSASARIHPGSHNHRIIITTYFHTDITLIMQCRMQWMC